MVEVAGMWELGWSAPITEVTQWEMVMREFGLERLNMTPVSGIKNRRVAEYPTMGELVDDSSLEPVFVDERGETALQDFDHPEDVMYVFGKITYSPFSDLVKKHRSIRIETPKPGMLMPHQALAIVMYDRGRK